MSQLMAFLLAASLLQQPGSTPPAGTGGRDPFSPQERTRLRREQKIDGRIKLYDAASQRLLKSVSTSVKEEKLEGLATTLDDWSMILAEALKDIEASVQPGKKPKPLIRFEIQLRKAIADVEELKTTTGVEAFDILNSWINHAEQVRSRFVDILFQR